AAARLRAAGGARRRPAGDDTRARGRRREHRVLGRVSQLQSHHPLQQERDVCACGSRAEPGDRRGLFDRQRARMIEALPRGGMRGAVNDTTGRLWAGGVCALLAALQFGCAAGPRTVADAGRARDVTAPERSALGNPPFYEVLGKRYYVHDSAENFVERGIASWYGPDFHRQRTSSGEIYDMYAMTAAHKTLPLATWVEVTNLENGRRVVVKVNARGPFVGDRIIDLSYAAAQALDMVRAGTARVEVRAIDPPSGTLVASA